jgi:hypothetical protein
MTLLGISAVLVALFVIGPLIVAGRGQARPAAGWRNRVFGALGARFMLIECRCSELRAAARTPCLLIDRHALLSFAWNRVGCGMEPPVGRGFAATQRRTAVIVGR